MGLQHIGIETRGFARVIAGGVKAAVAEKRAPTDLAEVFARSHRPPMIYTGGYTSRPSVYVDMVRDFAKRDIPVAMSDNEVGNGYLGTLVRNMDEQVAYTRAVTGSDRFSVGGQSQGGVTTLGWLVHTKRTNPALLEKIDVVAIDNAPFKGGVITNAAVGDAARGLLELLPSKVQRLLGPGAELLPGSPALRAIEDATPDLLDGLPPGLYIDNFVSDVTPGWMPGGHDLLVPKSSARLPQHERVLEHQLHTSDGIGSVGHLSSHRNKWVVDTMDRVMAHRQRETS